MRAMGGRPVLMQRFPKGAGGPSFFQKRVPDNAPDWLETTTVQTVNGTPSRALVAADVAHVAWAVNLACLGFHVWPQPAPTTPSTPTSCAWTSTRSPARASPRRARPPGSSRRCSTSSASPRFPKTTGNRGLHVYVRLQPRWDSYEVRSAAVAVARELERRRPDILTAAWWKEERGERIFVDYNQNAPHKTVFGAWSVRARKGAQVSTPLRWEELDEVDPDALTLATVPGARRARRRPVGRDRRRAAVARAAARDARARPRERPARRAVAAGLPQAARRAAARRAEPRRARTEILRPVAADSDRVGALSDGRRRRRARAVERILATARETLGMQIALLHGDRRGRAGDPPGRRRPRRLGLLAGTQRPAGGHLLPADARRGRSRSRCPTRTPCRPAGAARARAEPSRPLAYLGVPLQLSTGRVYGTLCAASEQAPRRPARARRGVHARARPAARRRAGAPARGGPAGWTAAPAPRSSSDGRVAAPGVLGRGDAARGAGGPAGDRLPGGVGPGRPHARPAHDRLRARHQQRPPRRAGAVELRRDRRRGRAGGPARPRQRPRRRLRPRRRAEPATGQIGGWGLHIVPDGAPAGTSRAPPTGGVEVSFELASSP